MLKGNQKLKYKFKLDKQTLFNTDSYINCILNCDKRLLDRFKFIDYVIKEVFMEQHKCVSSNSKFSSTINSERDHSKTNKSNLVEDKFLKVSKVINGEIPDKELGKNEKLIRIVPLIKKTDIPVKTKNENSINEDVSGE